MNKDIEKFPSNLPKSKNTTFFANWKDVKKTWVLIDAKGLTVGKIAVVIANILRGRNKPDYTPHIDNGDNVIVINADKVVFTGKKETNKKYYKHTGHPGGIKEATPKSIRANKDPVFILKHAVKGMLGRGPMARERLGNLRLYSGENYKEVAQQPKLLDVLPLVTKNRKVN